MSDLLTFILEPYRGVSIILLILEIIAVFTGVLSVFFAQRENIWVFPTGIVSTGIYIYICFVYSLHGDFLINLYYTLMSIYGWWRWSNPKVENVLPISKMNNVDLYKTIGIYVFSAIFIIVIYIYTGRYNDMTSYLDTFTTAIFFAAMWLMANKKLEHWWFWILGNLVSIPLYWMKGLGLTSLQYAIFLILAIQGYFLWIQQYRLSENNLEFERERK